MSKTGWQNGMPMTREWQPRRFKTPPSANLLPRLLYSHLELPQLLDAPRVPDTQMPPLPRSRFSPRKSTYAMQRAHKRPWRVG